MQQQLWKTAHHGRQSPWKERMLIWARVASDSAVSGLSVSQEVLQEREAPPVSGVRRNRNTSRYVNCLVASKLCSLYEREDDTVLLAQQSTPHIVQLYGGAIRMSGMLN